MKPLNLLEISTREKFRILLDQEDLGPYTLDRDGTYRFPDSVGCYKEAENKWCLYNVSFYREIYGQVVFEDQVAAYKEMGRRLGLSRDFSLPLSIPTIEVMKFYLYRIKQRNELARKYRMGYSLDYEINVLEQYIELEERRKDNLRAIHKLMEKIKNQQSSNRFVIDTRCDVKLGHVPAAKMIAHKQNKVFMECVEFFPGFIPPVEVHYKKKEKRIHG